LRSTAASEALVLRTDDGSEPDQPREGLEAFGTGEVGAFGAQDRHVGFRLLQRALLHPDVELEATCVILDGIEREGGAERCDHQGPVDPAMHLSSLCCGQGGTRGNDRLPLSPSQG
jgi:hypothetical protein